MRRFNFCEAKPVTTPLSQHFRLSSTQSPQTEDEKSDMQNVPYANGIGSVMYAMVCSRPNLAYAVCVMSHFMAKPGRQCWEALKWVFRYIKGTLKLGLLFKKAEVDKRYVTGYVDSDFAGSIDTRKSLTGYVFTLFGTAISWKAKLQSVMALSTTEAEYIAITKAVKEAL